MTRIDELSPAELKRLEAAWADPELTTLAVSVRFRLSHKDLREARRKFGRKARPGVAERVDGGKPHRLLTNGWAP